jgi:phosphopantetheine--protein transferase-like protein
MASTSDPDQIAADDRPIVAVSGGVFGIGCDLVRVARLQRLLEGRFSERFLKRAFHESEIACVRAQLRQARGEEAAQYAASRWAVKEAVFKAIGGQWRLRFPDVYVESVERRPTLRFAGATLQRMQAAGVTAHFVTISHEDQYALAHVVLCGDRKIEPIQRTNLPTNDE